MFILIGLTQHVSGIIMPIIRRTDYVNNCMWSMPGCVGCTVRKLVYQLSHSAHSSCPNSIPTFTQCTQLVYQLCTTAANTTRHSPHTVLYIVCSPDDGHNDARNMLVYDSRIPTFTQCTQLVFQLCTTAANTTRHTPHAVVYIVCSPDDGHNDARNMLR